MNILCISCISCVSYISYVDKYIYQRISYIYAMFYMLYSCIILVASLFKRVLNIKDINVRLPINSVTLLYICFMFFDFV